MHKQGPLGPKRRASITNIYGLTCAAAEIAAALGSPCPPPVVTGVTRSSVEPVPLSVRFTLEPQVLWGMQDKCFPNSSAGAWLLRRHPA